MKGISEKFTQRWGTVWKVTVTKEQKTFHRYEDAVRVRNHFYETGELLNVAVFNPDNEKYLILTQEYGLEVRITQNGKFTYKYVRTIDEAVKTRNEFFGMTKKKCKVCGEEFWDKFNDDTCNSCYMKEFRAREEKEKADEEEIEFNTQKEIRYTHPELVEKEARKQGKHYADIQKEKTLNMLGRIKIPAFALRPEQKATFEALYGSNWEAFYNTI